jgi:hypothetical protein
VFGMLQQHGRMVKLEVKSAFLGTDPVDLPRANFGTFLARRGFPARNPG